MVVPTLSRTGNGSSVIGRPVERLAHEPTHGPALVRAGLLDGREHVVEPGQLDAVEAGDAEVGGHAQPEGLRRPHRSRGEQVGLGDDGGRPPVGRHVEQQPGGGLPGLDGEVVGLHDRGVGAGDRAEPREPARGIRVGRAGHVAAR